MAEEKAEEARLEAEETQAEMRAKAEEREMMGAKHMALPEDFIEHSRNACREMREAWRSLLPPGFREHRRAARREALLAMRSLVDATLDRMIEMTEDKPQARRRRKTRIEVQ